jgi:hypothetical protein
MEFDRQAAALVNLSVPPIQNGAVYREIYTYHDV